MNVIETTVGAVDALNNVLSDLGGAAVTLSLKASVEGDDLASMLSRVLDTDIDALRGVIEWIERSER